MLKGNKDIATGLVSGIIARAIKTSYEGEGMVAWDTAMMAPLLSGIIQFSNNATNILLTDFRDSAMVSNRGGGVEGKIPSNVWIGYLVSEFCVWFKEMSGHEYLPKRVKHLRKVLGNEIRVLNSNWKPVKRQIGGMRYD